MLIYKLVGKLLAIIYVIYAIYKVSIPEIYDYLLWLGKRERYSGNAKIIFKVEI